MNKLCRALFKYGNKIKLVEKINAQLCSSLKWEPVWKNVTSWSGPSLVELLPPLLIHHGSSSYLLVILTHLHEMKKDDPYRGNFKRRYLYRRHDEKDATKRRGSIAPLALTKTINFITVMDFPGLFQGRGLYSWNIKIVCNKYSVNFFACIPYIIYFTRWTHFCACFIPVPLITTCSHPYVCSASNLNLYYFFWLFECMWWLPCHTAKLYPPSSWL